jgi:hypothetical protein
MATKAHDHPFFCEKKGRRKSVTETPEYLTKDDWDLLAQIVQVLKDGDLPGLIHLLRGNRGQNAEAFFYRMAAWPEGLRYFMEGSTGYQHNCLEGWRERESGAWEAALTARHGELFAACSSASAT